MNRGHVIRLDPTAEQASAFARAAGVARFAYNWALAEWNRQYAAGEKPAANRLRKQFNAIKGEQFPWIYESPKDANAQAFADLNVAFKNFFASCKRKGRKVGYPTFRRRGENDSFYISNDKFSVGTRDRRGTVTLPFVGEVRMQEPLRWSGKIMSARVSRRTNEWYISINVKTETRKPHVHARPVVGIDLGLKTAVVVSRGESTDAPKPLKINLRRMARANRRFHRRMKGSANRNKARIQLARIHQRIANIRKDFWDKLTTDLCRENQTVVIEDLSIEFMKRNRRLSRAVLDVSPGMFKPMMTYKAETYGTEVVVADRFYPSTQRCSGCGHIKTDDERLTLADRRYVCAECGMTKDRDENAACNLEQYPGLTGNWSHKTRTPAEIATSTRCSRASGIVEAGTEQVGLT